MRFFICSFIPYGESASLSLWPARVGLFAAQLTFCAFCVIIILISCTFRRHARIESEEVMKYNPFERVWWWATIVVLIATTGLLTGVGFNILSFAFQRWAFWYGLCRALYHIGIWTFQIFTPLFSRFCRQLDLYLAKPIVTSRRSQVAPFFISFQNARRYFYIIPSRLEQS